jgi:sec-independent protein translocase protein TatA
MLEDLLQPRHLLVILAVALFLFGPKKLPELGKGLAEGIRGFKDAMKGPSKEVAEVAKVESKDPV